MKNTYQRKKRALKSEINVVPLLDVLLVLLLIFMATVPVITQSVEVDLPGSSSTKKVPSNDNKLPVIIEVTGIDKYTLVINHQRIEKLLVEELIKQIRSHLQLEPKTVFLIGGEKDVAYNEIIKALNMLNQAGVTAVGLMTQPL